MHCICVYNRLVCLNGDRVSGDRVHFKTIHSGASLLFRDECISGQTNWTIVPPTTPVWANGAPEKALDQNRPAWLLLDPGHFKDYTRCKTFCPASLFVAKSSFTSIKDTSNNSREPAEQLECNVMYYVLCFSLHQ